MTILVPASRVVPCDLLVTGLGRHAEVVQVVAHPAEGSTVPARSLVLDDGTRRDLADTALVEVARP